MLWGEGFFAQFTLQGGDDFVGSGDANVGLQEQGFDFVDGFFVERALANDGFELIDETASGFVEALAQLVEPGDFFERDFVWATTLGGEDFG